MSHSLRHMMKAKDRASQKAKEGRVHRNTTRKQGGRKSVDLGFLASLLSLKAKALMLVPRSKAGQQK